MPEGKENILGMHRRRPASFKCCHQTSILRKEQAQPDMLLPPVALGRPASPAWQSLEHSQATSGM